jgi:thiol-disulfide isomerase/thioredoxin
MKTLNVSKSALFFVPLFFGLQFNPKDLISSKKTVLYCDFKKDQHVDKLADSLLLHFPFKDTLNKTVRILDFKGKFVFIDFWYSGCGACISANHALRLVHKKLENENIVFLSISVDKNREMWMESITKGAKKSKLDYWAGKYNPAPGTIILYTGGSGYDNDLVKNYNPRNAYPQLLLLGPSGELITDHVPRPDLAEDDDIRSQQELIDFLYNAMSTKAVK